MEHCSKCGKELIGVYLDYCSPWKCFDCSGKDVIHSQHGTKLFVNTFDAGYSYDKELAQKFLKLGKSYTVDEIEVGGWNTTIYLKEIPNIGFNSVFFDVCE